MDEPFALKSFAKINWTLRIAGRRDDGFHEICTLLQTISLHDVLTFERSDRIEMTCNDPSIPCDERNLIIKAAVKLSELTGYAIKGKVSLDKRIPSPGGLGGGSSNAIVAIFGFLRLNDNIKRVITVREFQEMAVELGTDVPFFLRGGTAAGMSRGDHVLPTELQINEPAIVIVTPNIMVHTGEAFAQIEAPALTKSASESILTVCRKEAEAFDPRSSALTNDFEPSVFAAHPEIARVKRRLLELGAVNAALSGSGASVFAVFDKEETRQTALKALDQESTWRKFAVSTVSRDEYIRESFGI